MREPRTKNAIKVRKSLIERFNKSPHSSFVEVATDLITHDRLFANLPRDRGEAIRFLDDYSLILRAQETNRRLRIKPLPDGVTRESMGLN
jgi:hypothetical protein